MVCAFQDTRNDFIGKKYIEEAVMHILFGNYYFVISYLGNSSLYHFSNLLFANKNR
jgi:membrane-anchored protein YejM (alkaline phosphatase superfamily)